MTIEVKLTFTTMEEAAEAIIKMGLGAPTLGGVDPEPAPKPKAKRTREPKPAEEAPSEEPKQNIKENPENRVDPNAVEDTEEAPADEQVEAELTAEEAEKLFTEGVRPAMTELMKAAGQEKARAFLNGYGGLDIKKVSDLPTERYKDFIEKANKAASEAVSS